MNDGRPGTINPCYGAEMTWADDIDSTHSAPVQVYLNTADPGNNASDWPTSGSSTQYGTCTAAQKRHQTVGADSQACAYQYGVQEATYAKGLISASTAPQVVWLDVETANTWQTHRLQDLNEAVLDGMVDTLSPTYTVGVYSTTYQWNKILDPLDPISSPILGSLYEWIPGASSTDPTSFCSTDPHFTSGLLEFVQYTSTYDYDVACQANSV